MLMVNDKVSGADKDIAMTPIKRSALSFSYYISTVTSTMLICFVALIAGMIYLGYVGWYLSAWDIIALIFDVFLLVLFGTALSSIVNVFLSTQGQISTVGTIVSSGYGFICGAYMPISQFNEGLQNIISFLPGTYGTVLLRKHAIRGAFDAMLEQNIPVEVVESFKDAVDCNLYVLDKSVSIGAMYTVLVGSTVALMGIYVFINSVLFKKREFNK
jgi:multidrug/hemolysin transport system permease protein